MLKKPLYSYKFKKAGFRYKVALCIKTAGNICWWVGPYLPGTWNDEMFFKRGLVQNLEPGERCEADGGYVGSAPLFAKCPGVVEANSDNAEMQQRVRSWQEAVNKCFKNWGNIVNPFLPQVA